MPKIIDPDERRREIVRAACRVIIGQGVAALSLTSVAAESGLAIGSVRHYVGGHDDLRRLTLQIIGDDLMLRLNESARPLIYPGAGLSVAARRRRSLEWLEQLLPMDDDRLAEATIWTAMREAARTDPELAAVMAGIDGRRLALVRRVLGRVRPHWSPAVRAVESRRLSALLRGLTIERVYEPESVTPAQVQRVLRQHLSQLAQARR
ncbi:TetR/AcrR family transcriptional regulator [Microlunatus soli]|uniref:Regulatory protein, tetR family n=1 Tax=Microlunatus soli TaxID=630515 RepID=A0A1H1XSQ5_9ACTN|nr:TetR family transcriptional regulator C-terminal domain-containing protein [Microlunatus soli]SDT12247.1 regulatory protein, tetR family [Microlunatus soli]